MSAHAYLLGLKTKPLVHNTELWNIMSLCGGGGGGGGVCVCMCVLVCDSRTQKTKAGGCL